MKTPSDWVPRAQELNLGSYEGWHHMIREVQEDAATDVLRRIFSGHLSPRAFARPIAPQVFPEGRDTELEERRASERPTDES